MNRFDDYACVNHTDLYTCELLRQGSIFRCTDENGDVVAGREYLYLEPNPVCNIKTMCSIWLSYYDRNVPPGWGTGDQDRTWEYQIEPNMRGRKVPIIIIELNRGVF